MGDHEIETLELVAEPASPPEFLPLAARRVLYVAGLLGAVAAPILAVSQPDYAAAIVAGAGLLSSAALGTALANPTPRL